MCSDLAVWRLAGFIFGRSVLGSAGGQQPRCPLRRALWLFAFSYHPGITVGFILLEPEPF